jgi:hypothetical protein
MNLGAAYSWVRGLQVQRKEVPGIGTIGSYEEFTFQVLLSSRRTLTLLHELRSER